jgi:hypothetical protein
MAERAAACGLTFAHPTGVAEKYDHRAAAPTNFSLDGSEHLSPVRDSYSEFMFGLYKLWKSIPFISKGRCFRRMMVPADGAKQAVDSTVKRKWDADAEYRPRNYSHAGREDFGMPPVNVAGALLPDDVIPDGGGAP